MSNIHHPHSNSLLSPRSRSSWPSTNSIFFDSPFSTHPSSTRLPSSPSISAGFLFDKSIAEEPEPPMEVPNFKLQTNFNLRSIPSSAYHHHHHLPKHHQEYQDQPDRLDRLLAEFDAQTISISSASTSKTSLDSLEVHHLSEEEEEEEEDQRRLNQTEIEDEAWDSSLVSTLNQTKRLSCDCVNCGMNLGFEIGTSSEGCGSASTSGGSGEDSWTNPVRVRFCEGAVEEILTWSAETYDRKGPEPVNKLSMREMIELKLIKEEVLRSS
ncbi:hypothetical protein DFH28DRAFT_1109447 [Melampsora americana]|nr:hypothetical protein DFH28DRAFT_1109447 [Melampsora americana]